tara:strand:- start:560 stop:748 length:189 start_codon:yes stop_codon:yes gene_type:complete
MRNQTKIAVTILDMVLILMTATWMIFGVYRGITILELIYSWTYVIVNIATLILNLRLINKIQ